MTPFSQMRIHILGASGSGTTTFGRALASELSFPFFDTDDFYWMPSNPPYVEKRPVSERIRLMKELFLERPRWVLSGSLTSWSETFIPYFDCVIFLSLNDELRLKRLRHREVTRYGEDALSEGGVHYKAYSAFMNWAKQYENVTFDGRSRSVHEKWLSKLECQIIRLNSEYEVDELVKRATKEINVV